MSDIIERLRASCEDGIQPDDVYEAADEIARLRAEVDAEKAEVFRLQSSHSALYADVEALRADAERYRWLRNEGNPYALLVVGRYHKADVRPFYDAELDAAIDAAMRADK